MPLIMVDKKSWDVCGLALAWQICFCAFVNGLAFWIGFMAFVLQG
jgi:hypothetical protein